MNSDPSFSSLPEPDPVGSEGVPLPAPTELTGLTAEQLLPLIYDQLRNLARRYMSSERPDHTLETTALVHEAYVRIVGAGRVDWENQQQFFHAAAEAMRRILIDRGRQRRQLKHGGTEAGPPKRVPLTAVDLGFETDWDEILSVDEAILRLEQVEPDIAKMVRLRFYAGLGVDETAKVLGVSPRTITRDWTYARAWLIRELGYEFH